MLDVLKDLIVGFFGALLVECAPKLALRLVQLAARAMPTAELREEKLSDWTADVLSVEGNAQKLVAAFWILVNVPSIRSSYGAPGVKVTPEGLLAFAWTGMVACQVLLVVVGLFGLAFAFGTTLWAASQGHYLSAAERNAVLGLISVSKSGLQHLWYSVPITVAIYFLTPLKKRRRASTT